MYAYRQLVLPWLCIVFATTSWLTNAVGQSTVVLETTDSGHRLLLDGEPYFIEGVGGRTHLAELAAAGGNAIRTWDMDNLDGILDDAHEHNLTVCVGFWLGHERHGFDYQDQASVDKQLADCINAVRKYKEHPAILMWAIGNEMEGDGTNPAIWYAIDHVARECKRLDPHHPTMTVIAELGKSKVQNIDRYCPNIDIIGVNAYGGIASLGRRYRATGGGKPYIVTEFGPFGPWEVGKTKRGSAIEATSTTKGDNYAEGYRKAVAAQRGLCLGSYAFLWGNKQETPATWFGMLLPDGSRLAAVDAMTEAWTGSPPSNRCPRIESLVVDRTSKLKPGEAVKATLVASDPERDRLAIRWVLRKDSGTIQGGGDYQVKKQSFADAVSGDGPEATVTAPTGGGGYRLFAYVHDGKGGAAVANVPLYVDAPTMLVSSPKAKLPFVLYADGATSSPYAPSGYMGNAAAIKMTLDSTDNPHSGKTCLRAEYQANDDWGGVLWQSPANDWDGEKPGGLDLTGASELEFWVRGATGGETVSFVLGVLDGNQKYRDSAKGELNNVRLTIKWQKLRIPLDGRDLRCIKTGFGWSVTGQDKPVIFYLDDIRYIAR